MAVRRKRALDAGPTKRESAQSLALMGVLYGSNPKAALTAYKSAAPKPKTPSQHLSEHQEQTLLFAWARKAQCTIPELTLLFAVPNGGRRDAVTGARLKAEGVMAGMPDICLPVPRNGSGALYVELKARHRGRLSEAQKERIAALTAAGNQVSVCYGWEAARDAILAYLGRTA